MYMVAGVIVFSNIPCHASHHGSNLSSVSLGRTHEVGLLTYDEDFYNKGMVLVFCLIYYLAILVFHFMIEYVVLLDLTNFGPSY